MSLIPAEGRGRVSEENPASLSGVPVGTERKKQLAGGPVQAPGTRSAPGAWVLASNPEVGKAAGSQPAPGTRRWQERVGGRELISLPTLKPSCPENALNY